LILRLRQVGVSYCLNPSCLKPLNPGDAKFCCTCGTKLLVAERYRAVAVMGQGGFGRTLRGIDEHLPSRPACAIKQFMPIAWSSPTDDCGDKAFELFQQEAIRLDQLGEHDQIPRLLAHVSQEQHWYLVQEFIAGNTLSQELGERGCFQEAQIWELLAELLPLLAHLNQQQVIHRDIKPDNILRRQPDQKLVLVDFGAAKFATATLLNQTGTMISSAGYTAPEQLLGRAVPASDLYSLGATCIHLLTGMPPYELYDSDEATWSWHPHLPKPVSHQLSQFLTKLLQPPLKQRYASAEAAFADLPGFSGGDPAQPSHPPPSANRAPSASATSGATPTPPTTSPWRCVRVFPSQAGAVIGVGLTGKLEGEPDPSQPRSDNSRSDLLVMVSQTGAIKLWDLASKQLQTALGAHAGKVQTMTLAPQQPLLICGGEQGRLSLWQLATGQLLASFNTLEPSEASSGQRCAWGHLRGGDPCIQTLSLSHSQQILAVGSHHHLHLWHLDPHHDPPDQLENSEFASVTSEAPLSSLSFSPQDEWLLGGGQDGKVRVWALPNPRKPNLALEQRLSWQAGPIHALSFSPDGEVLVAGGQDGHIKFWQVCRSDPLQVLFKGNQDLHTLQFSPQGDVLAAGFQDGTVRFWHWPSGNLIATHKEHQEAVTCLCFSPDGQLMASGSHDQTARLWRRSISQ
jgi:serine/threonine protein kinase